jgi:hypothetical protein|nr:MAG TPA: hypothetical protein [Caudoviricetes sp.]
MDIAMIALVTSMGLSFIGMAAAIVLDKPRLIDFFCLTCMALGGLTLVLCFINLLLI